MGSAKTFAPAVVALFLLTGALRAQAADAVAVARPDDRIVVDVEGGAGGVLTEIRYGGQKAALSAPAYDARAAVGYRLGAFDAGFVGGGLFTSSFRDGLTSESSARQEPDSLRFAHAGAFATWHPARAPAFSVGLRIEGAYVWLPGVFPIFPPGVGQAIHTPFTATAYGAVASLGARYRALSSRRLEATVGLDLLDGYAAGGSGATQVEAQPVGAMISVGVTRR